MKHILLALIFFLSCTHKEPKSIYNYAVDINTLKPGAEIEVWVNIRKWRKDGDGAFRWLLKSGRRQMATDSTYESVIADQRKWAERQIKGYKEHDRAKDLDTSSD